jgi:hypothetical protein
MFDWLINIVKNDWLQRIMTLFGGVAVIIGFFSFLVENDWLQRIAILLGGVAVISLFYFLYKKVRVANGWDQRIATLIVEAVVFIGLLSFLFSFFMFDWLMTKDIVANDRITLIVVIVVIIFFSFLISLFSFLYKKAHYPKTSNTKPSEISTYNPFICGSPVSCDQLVGREKELRFIVERILNRGQSCAITGSPQSGKTSILECLRDSEQQAMLYGDRADNLIFSYVHISRLESQVNEALFWEYVLQPLQDRIADNPEYPLFKAYEKCQQKGFKTYTLETLIKQIKQADWQLVLLLDRFDSLLQHDTLNQSAFFGSLRSLTSLSKGALTLITTENKSLKQLNQESQDKEWYNLTSSPFYNIFQELILGPLPDSEIDELLSQGGYFSENDCRFIKKIAGGHPYLLQVVASLLWNAYKDGDEADSTKRQQRVEQDFYNQVEETLNNIWQSWTSKMQEAFSAVAQSDSLSEFKQELEELQKHGFVKKDEGDNWCVSPTIFLRFVRQTNQRNQH